MRKHYIDNIRCTTVLLVVIYHVIYMFNSITTEGVIGAITEFHGQDIFQYLCYPWFMVILFILSGMSAKYYLDTHSVKEFVRARTRKLLVPSTVGIFVFGWIQGYYNMAIGGAFETMDAKMPLFMLYPVMAISGTGVLWTIQVMWILSMVLLVVRKLDRGIFRERCQNWVNTPVLLLVGGAGAWLSAQILNTPMIAVYRFGIYGFAFLTGYFIFSNEQIIEKLSKSAIWLLIVAGILGISYTVMYYGQNYATAPVVNCLAAIAYGWAMCLAVIGCAKRWFNKQYSFTRFMKKRSFGLYVFHYLPLSVCAYDLTRYTSLPGAAIYLICTVAAFAGGLALNELISRIPVLRWCVLGIGKE